MNDIIDNGPEFLDADAVQNFKSLAYKIQINMSWLATMSIRRGLLLWKITPKLHYLTHLAEQAVLCNPRLVRNYRMESGILRSIGGEEREFYNLEFSIGPPPGSPTQG